MGALIVLVIAAACQTPRDSNDSGPTYVDQIDSILRAKCVQCHARVAPAGGWRADSYIGAVGCTASGAPASTHRDGKQAPLLTALERSDHAGFTSPEERAVLAAWIVAGAPRSKRGVHETSFADPRSPASHGRYLRTRHWAPMLDANDPDACGTCHDGIAARKPAITSSAANAPACTTCHTEPAGPLACSTCHGNVGGDGSGGDGSGPRAYPPRNRCFFPGDPDDHAHATHAGASASRSTGLPCSTCHPEPAPGQLGGVHANGWVDVWFDYSIAGREARFDASNKTCMGTCHARGGAHPAPAWGDAPMTCNDCHESPPRAHYAGACTNCHREANTTGTALSTPVLHANGKVDLGDGSGRCGACHGQGDDPWPSTGAHRAHAMPEGARSVVCETCHAVPSMGDRHPEGRGKASVRFAGLATHGGRRASYDPSTKTCAGTYCHEAGGGSSPAPRWTDGPAVRTCTSCHASPPPPPHVQSASCGGATCHEGRTSGLAMTPAGRLVHVDGAIDRGVP